MAERLVAARLADRGVIAISGADRRSFLQGLLTADLSRLTPERAIWAALLSPQGRYLFDFALVEDGARILFEAERSRLPALMRRLTFYRLRADVAIADCSADWVVMGLPGAAGAAALGLAAERGSCRRLEAAIAFVDPRLAALGARLLVPADLVDALLARLGLEPADEAPWDRLRLALGVPDGSRDLEVEKALAVESGFLELDIVSLTKGCFVGQELTARMAHRGLVKRRLLPVRILGARPTPGTPVLCNGRQVGELRSGRDDRALALLRLDALDAGPLEADGARLEPAIPAWLQEVKSP